MASYGNRFGYERLNMFPPVIKWLLGINVALFIIGMVPMGTEQGATISSEILFEVGALFPINTTGFHFWQYFTYMFLHGGFMHIFFNMLVLWMFGMELEQMWGSKRFLVFYLLCGLGAGLIHSVITLLMGTGGPTVGASGAIMGVMVAFGMIFPDRIIFVGFFFPLRAKYAMMLIIGLDLFSGVMGGRGVMGGETNVAHFAHLGGALIGFLLVQFGGKMTLGGIFDRLPWLRKTDSPPVITFDNVQRRASAPNVIDVEFRDLKHRENTRSSMPPTMNFGDDQARIDAILDKISKSGYQNLTEEEKSILFEASKKLK